MKSAAEKNSLDLIRRRIGATETHGMLMVKQPDMGGDSNYMVKYFDRCCSSTIFLLSTTTLIQEDDSLKYAE